MANEKKPDWIISHSDGDIEILQKVTLDDVAIIPKKYKNAKRNARLISAAPDLLEALQQLCAAVHTGDNTVKAMEDAYAAIKKATQ